MKSFSLYWYRTETNFGDAFSSDIVARLFDCEVTPGSKWSADLVAEGSVLDFALLRDVVRNGSGTWQVRMRAGLNRALRKPLTVWGSGMLFPLDRQMKCVPIRRPKFFALRGEKTREEMISLGLLSRGAELAFGDPGLFMSDLSDPAAEKSHRRGFVMHAHYWGSGEAARFQSEHPEILVIDPRRSPKEVVSDIAACSEIFSSSLHGLVVADALGIPNRWVALETPHADARRNMFKFLDYYSAFGQTRLPCRLEDVATVQPEDPIDVDRLQCRRRELEQAALRAREFMDSEGESAAAVAHPFFKVQNAVRVAIARRNYSKNLKRIRQDAGKRKIKVVFLVSELAKWKGQTVFDRLKTSDLFAPEIAVMALTRQAALPTEEQVHLEKEKVRYFRDRGMPVVDIQHFGEKGTKSIREIGADIVFYQQPWDLPSQMKPLAVSRRALTFYFPYYTPNYSETEIEIGHKMHHLLFGYMTCNEQMAEFYREESRWMCGGYAGDFLPLGHPALDEISFSENGGPWDGCVIYAPHWTIEFGSVVPELRYSTFLENGRFVLDYAKSHPEVRWAFKPHPALKETLVRSGAMSRREVENYYAEWARLGECCFSGPADYLRLFDRSRVLVTDCGSFLTEYGCTGKPVIRMVNPRLKLGSQPIVRDLYSTYYNVHDREELQRELDRVVVRGEDPLRGARHAALSAAGLTGHDASERIADYLEQLVKGDASR